MLERQARARAELVEGLENSRPERARALVQASNHQAPTLHPSGAPITNPSPEFKYRLYMNQLRQQDAAEVSRLDGTHAQERGQRQTFNELGKPPPTVAFNSVGAKPTHEPER
jgi:hypothetical protein